MNFLSVYSHFYPIFDVNTYKKCSNYLKLTTKVYGLFYLRVSFVIINILHLLLLLFFSVLLLFGIINGFNYSWSYYFFLCVLVNRWCFVSSIVYSILYTNKYKCNLFCEKCRKKQTYFTKSNFCKSWIMSHNFHMISKNTISSFW